MPSQPIRWDNISGSGLSEASHPLDSAASLFNGAFNGLQGALAQREAVDASNYQVTKTNNTNAFLDAVSKYTTPEALRSAQSDGTLDNLRQQFGYQIDAGAVRNAIDTRVSSLQQQAEQKINYDNAMRNESTAPAVDQLRSAILSGDKDAEAQARNTLSGLGYRDFGTQDAFADQRHRELQLRTQVDRASDDSHNTSVQGIAKSKADIAYQSGMLGVAQTNSKTEARRADIEQQRVTMDHVDRLQSRLSDAIKNGQADPKSTIGSPAGVAALNQIVESLKGDAQDVGRRYVANLLEKNPNMPLSAALVGATSVREQRWYERREGVANDAVDRAITAAGSPAVIDNQKRSEAAYAIQQANIQSLSQSLGRARTTEAASFPASQGGTAGAPTPAAGTVPNPMAQSPALTSQIDAAAAKYAAAPKVTMDSPTTTDVSGQSGHYGQNGWVPDTPAPVDPVQQAQAVLDSTKGKGYNDMTSAERDARSNARNVIKMAAAQQATAAADAVKSKAADAVKAGKIADLRNYITMAQQAQAQGRLLDDTQLKQSIRDLAVLSK